MAEIGKYGMAEVLGGYAATREAGLRRAVRSNRDLLDMLVQLKGDDAFWSALEAARAAEDGAVDLDAVRVSLPSEPFPADRPVEDCLESVGLDASAIEIVLDDEADRALVDDRIGEAFLADSPQAIAKALESLLSESPTRLVSKRFRDMSALAASYGTLFAVCTLAGLAFGSLAACYKGVTPERW